jgi:hypothetical protein
VNKSALSGLLLLILVQPPIAAEQDVGKPAWSTRVQMVLEATKPLEFDRGRRLPLYLWPAMNPGKLDDRTAELLIRKLDRRGIGLISTWSPHRREETLQSSQSIARVQTRLGLRVNVNANACLYHFFNGDERTAHVDEAGKPFWDDSFNVRSRKHKMGCPFALDFRKDPMREQVEYFAQAYKDAGLKIDFIFADWEIDGPIEFNRAHDASKKCARCREHIRNVEDFLSFQKALRQIRSRLQRYAYAEPITSRFPDALVGNYAVYPHNGHRYWYDYFEYYVKGQPCIVDQRAKYRVWYDDFPGTGYTFAMPVVYTWYPTYQWYDFEDADYRWFYNMLLVASNAGENTPASTPIISFVHWHTTAPPDEPDPSVKQLSQAAYQELLWHMLLRGTDTFFLWCPAAEDAVECRLVHEVYGAAQQYGEFIEKGTPVSFEVPKRPGPVISGLRLGQQVLIRRTEFGDCDEPVKIVSGDGELSVEPAPGKCQVLCLP